MKTVNKILLTAFIILILAVVSLVTLVRFGLSGEVIHGTGEIIELNKTRTSLSTGWSCAAI